MLTDENLQSYKSPIKFNRHKVHFKDLDEHKKSCPYELVRQVTHSFLENSSQADIIAQP